MSYQPQFERSPMNELKAPVEADANTYRGYFF